MNNYGSGKSNAMLRIGRCPFYEEDFDENGIVMQVFCEHPEVVEQVRNGKVPICPHRYEYVCDIPIHNKNLVKVK
jgi:hypothetical protein